MGAAMLAWGPTNLRMSVAMLGALMPVMLASFSVGPGQTQDVLPQKRQDHVVADRRHLVDAGLAEFSFDVVLVDKAIAAVDVEADIARLPACLGGDEFRSVCFCTALLAGVEQFGGAVAHQVRGEHLGVSP